MMTIQEVFDKVAVHLLTQMAPSVRLQGEIGEECAYRGDDGKMCAVGCLIESKHYSKKLEGDVVGGSSVNKALEASGIPLTNNPEMQSLLREVQRIHDHTDAHYWMDRLCDTAEKYDLSAAVLERFR